MDLPEGQIADLVNAVNKVLESWNTHQPAHELQAAMENLDKAAAPWNHTKEEQCLDHNVILKMKGKSGHFRCPCGCNVFSKYSETKFICNSCRTEYTAE